MDKDVSYPHVAHFELPLKQTYEKDMIYTATLAL